MYSDYFIGNQMMIKKKSLSMEVLIMEKYCMLRNLPASKDVTEERRQTIDFLHELSLLGKLDVHFCLLFSLYVKGRGTA